MHMTQGVIPVLS